MHKDPKRWYRRGAAFGLVVAALVNAILSYRHQRDLSGAAGQNAFEAMLWPLGVDALMLASGMRIALDDRPGWWHGWSTFSFWAGFGLSLTANWLSVDSIAAIAAHPWVRHAVASVPALCLLLAAESVMASVRGQVAIDDKNQPTAPTAGGTMATQNGHVREYVPDVAETPFRRRNGKRAAIAEARAVEGLGRWPGKSPNEIAALIGHSRSTVRRAKEKMATAQA
jgi:hypothetical protein